MVGDFLLQLHLFTNDDSPPPFRSYCLADISDQLPTFLHNYGLLCLTLLHLMLLGGLEQQSHLSFSVSALSQAPF
jgi:hypothetical protein